MRCSKCGRDDQPFSPSVLAKGSGWCRTCSNAYYRERRANESPDDREARLEARRLKRHGRAERVRHPITIDRAEYGRRQKRRDYRRHREKRIAAVRARRNADLDAARARERDVYQRRRAKHQAVNRARERRMEPLDADSLAFEAILRDDPCAYCGRPMQQIDHVEPVAHGGRNHWSNLAAACQPCNRAKSDRFLLHALLQSNLGGQP